MHHKNSTVEITAMLISKCKSVSQSTWPYFTLPPQAFPLIKSKKPFFPDGKSIFLDLNCERVVLGGIGIIFTYELDDIMCIVIKANGGQTKKLVCDFCFA